MECKANTCVYTHTHMYERMNDYDKWLPNRYLYNAEIATILPGEINFLCLHLLCSSWALFFCRKYAMK